MCGTGFNQAAAQVVCRNLNLTGGTPRYGAVYGKGKVPILLSNLRCRGRESELSACLYSAATKQCTHANDVGISCKGKFACVGWPPPGRRDVGGCSSPHRIITMMVLAAMSLQSPAFC